MKLGVTITTKKLNGEDVYVIKTPYSTRMLHICKGIPGRRWWSPDEKAWVAVISSLSTVYLKNMLPMAEWEGEAKKAVDVLAPDEVKIERKKFNVKKIKDYKFETAPFPHQGEAFYLSKDKPAYALFMEQRTGKTKVIIDNIAYLFEKGKIDAAIIITLASVVGTWADEFTIHWPKRLKRDIHKWDSTNTQGYNVWLKMKRHPSSIPILILNIEGLSRKRIEKEILKFTTKYKSVFGAVDESTTIANPTAARSKAVFEISEHCEYRRILSGTPIKQSVIDLFGQFKFLDGRIFKMTYSQFKKFVAEWEGYQVLEWRNLDHIQAVIQPYIFRVLRKEVWPDMPEQVPQTRTVQMTSEQKKLYNAVFKKMRAEMGEKKLTVDYIITKYLRISQITGGFIQWDNEEGTEPVPGENPKLKALMDIIEYEPSDTKTIIWAKFRPEVELISNELRREYGNESVVEFHGGISKVQKERARKQFQNKTSKVRFFVGQVETGGIGIDLDEAGTMVYYSNSYSYEAREQSLSRPMSVRQKRAIGVYDIVMEGTVDEMVLEAIKIKKSLAALIDKKHIESLIENLSK